MTKPITLEAIKAQQSKLLEMIAKFESQAKTDFVIPEATIVLQAGERYAGIILDDEGNPYYHLILLPGEKEREWMESAYWAASQGGMLPTRREQSLLFANLKDQFKPRYYWSSDRHKDFSGRAWTQGFSSGPQDDFSINAKLLARAVRRVYIG